MKQLLCDEAGNECWHLKLLLCLRHPRRIINVFYSCKLESNPNLSQEMKFKTLDLSFFVSRLTCYWFILNSVYAGSIRGVTVLCNGKKQFLLWKPTQTTGKLMIRTSKLLQWVVVHFLRNEETPVIFYIFVWMTLQLFQFEYPKRSPSAAWKSCWWSCLMVKGCWQQK